MMQDHPIELLCDGLAQVAQAFGRGAAGLVAGLGLIGLLWVSAMRPADAAFARVVTPVPLAGAVDSPRPVISVTTLADRPGAKAAPAPLAPATSGAGDLAVAFPVCELVIDPSASDPLAGGCATPAPLAN